MPIRDRIQQRRWRSLADEATVSLMVAAEHLEQAAVPVWEGGHPRNEIARRMIHRAPDVTRMLDRLARQHLVARVRNPDDRRESIATITRSGLALLERIDPDVYAVQQSITRSLSERELRELVRLCDALVP